MRLIACSHTGKIGDALYSLPTIRALCDRHRAKSDFYTTPDCKPMSSLMEYQSCINRVIITPDFVNETCLSDNSKPWRVEFPSLPVKDYEAVYDLSFHSFPDCPLPEFIAKQAGFDYPMGSQFSIETVNIHEQIGPYYVLAPGKRLGFENLFNEIVQKSPFPVLIVGAKGEMIDHGDDRTGMTILRMASAISKAKGFIGLLSSPLVVAQAFDIPKVVIFDGVCWDPRHQLRNKWTDYLVNPSAEWVLKTLERKRI